MINNDALFNNYQSIQGSVWRVCLHSLVREKVWENLKVYVSPAADEVRILPKFASRYENKKRPFSIYFIKLFQRNAIYVNTVL